MAQLPADRTKLAAAQGNMSPSITASSQKLKDALTEAYDTIDTLNQKVDTHGSNATLPHADKSVTRAKLADKVVGSEQLDDAAVGQIHHQDNGIPSRAIGDNVILQRHISDGAVGPSEIQSGAVQRIHIQNGAVGSSQLDPTLFQNYGDIAVQAKFAEIAINVKTYGAVGDGITDDTQAIQSALDLVNSNGGGKVYMPEGVYYVISALEIGSNVELFGAGMYKTTLLPKYTVGNTNRDVISAYGEPASRLKNIVLHDFRVSGQDRIDKNSFIYTDIFGRIYLRCIDNLTVYNLSSSGVSQTVFMHACRHFTIDRLNVHYSNTAVSLTNDLVGDNEHGVISNIIANDVSTVVDFGGGGSEVVVTNIVGDYVEFPFVQEGIDIGGSKNIVVSNSIFKNFNGGAIVKGESGKQWDNITFDNVQFIDFKNTGLNVLHGTETGGGKITIKGCDLRSQLMTTATDPDIAALNIRENIRECHIFDTTVDVNGYGLHGNKYGLLNINGLTIKCGGQGIYVDNTAGTTAVCKINNVFIDSGLDGIRILSSAEELFISNFVIKNCVGEGIYLNQTRFPKVHTGIIKNVTGHGLSIRTTDNEIQHANSLNGVHVKISGVRFENWGNGALTNRAGIKFLISRTSTGSLKNINISDTELLLTNSAPPTSQIGIDWTSLVSVDYSVLDNVTFYKVPQAQAGGAVKGTNMKEDIMIIS